MKTYTGKQLTETEKQIVSTINTFNNVGIMFTDHNKMNGNFTVTFESTIFAKDGIVREFAGSKLREMGSDVYTLEIR